MMEAIFGLVGVLIGSGITWFQTIWVSKQELNRSARYLAIRVACIFDKYVEDCAAVVRDDGLSYGQRTPEGYLEPQVKSPGPPVYPDDIDWKSVDPNLMYEILSFPPDVEAGDNAIAFSWDMASPPDYEEGFEERADQYAQFGLKAYELASKLRGKYGIPDKDYQDWNPVAELQEKLDTIQTRRKKGKDQAQFLSRVKGQHNA